MEPLRRRARHTDAGHNRLQQRRLQGRIGWRRVAWPRGDGKMAPAALQTRPGGKEWILLLRLGKSQLPGEKNGIFCIQQPDIEA